MSARPAGPHVPPAHLARLDDSDPPVRPVAELRPAERTLQPTSRLIMAHDPCDPHCEKIRALRTELLLRRESLDRGDIIALISPCAGEGRSVLAAELAIAFAQTGHPTLLVDADMRRPQQHVLFGAQNHQGLAQAIAHGEPAELQAVWGLPRMSLLTAGVLPKDPLELLSSRRFAAIIDEWRRDFEFVVIDTAPVSHFSDGLAVARLVGRVLALSRAQHTPSADMKDMLRRLAATRSQILGAVINHF